MALEASPETAASAPKASPTHYLGLATLAATLLLVAVGGFTRGSGSGYGCADQWPLCENGLLGGLLPRVEYHMIIEWSHRWLAAAVGLLAIATAVSAWRRWRRDRAVLWSALGSVVVIGIQAWVGRAVVKAQLDADLVSLHLLISMTVVALVVTVVVGTRTQRERGAEREGRWVVLFAFATFGSLLVLLLGSLVHNLYVPGWPLVFDTLVPDLGARTILIHFLHRVAVAGYAVFLAYVLVRVLRSRRSRFERALLGWAAILYLVNIGLGALHVFTQVGSALLVAAHLALASLVWALTVAATADAALRQPARETAPTLSP
jgi:cytochrome c oxidase assembly protein subunit 15